MRTTIFSSQCIREFLLKHSVATMEQLKEVIGTSTDMTIFRKLKDLGYLSSYTHRGKYYTLKQIAQFDDKGLWTFNNIWFSHYGTLVCTAQTFVNKAEAGYTTSELRHSLHTEVKGTLRDLLQQQHITRQTIEGMLVYLAIDPTTRQRQIMARRDELTRSLEHIAQQDASVLAHELRAAIILFVSLLDERQRRLWAGLESIRMGHGGDQTLATLLNIDPHTVARGRHELLNRDVAIGRIRKSGGGRPSIKKKS